MLSGKVARDPAPSDALARVELVRPCWRDAKGEGRRVRSAERSGRKCRQNDARPQDCGETHPDIPPEAAASAPNTTIEASRRIIGRACWRVMRAWASDPSGGQLASPDPGRGHRPR